MRTFSAVTLIAAAADGVTKWHASRFSPDVVYNLGQTRFGMPLNWQVAVTFACMFALLYVAMREAYRVPGLDIMAGMMMGGAIGNVISIMSGPPGVLDFIRLGDVVFNIADVFLWLGSLGVVYVVAMAALRERR